MQTSSQRSMYRCVDFHSHLLPAVDDGSASAEQSCAMMAESRRQGVTLMVATPHFYPENERPSEFLARREVSVRCLLDNGYDVTVHPRVALGAEVAYFPGISRCEELEQLCIVGTKTILIEMPFSRWTNDVVQEIEAIARSRQLLPVLAHVDRYTDARNAALRQYLTDVGALLQLNADELTHVFRGRRAKRWLCEETAHLIGSDCHNMTDRPPCMLPAHQALQRAAETSGLLDRLESIAHYALNGARLLETMANEKIQGND